MAEPTEPPRAPERTPLRTLLASVRMRTTIAATVIVAIALVAGAFALVQIQRATLVEGVDDTLDARADDIVGIVESGIGATDTVDVAREEESLIQVVDEEGDVVLASDNVVGLAPVVDPDSVTGVEELSTRSGLPIDEEEDFRVWTERLDSPGGPVVLIVASSLEPIEENIETLVANLRWAVPLLVALVAILTWFIVGWALRPVDDIRQEVESISDRHLDQRVPEPRSGDEIARLARTMNSMLDRLEASWRRQEQFVADASHELRSPLTAMRSRLEVDAEHPETADAESSRRAVLDEVGQLEALIDDLLYLARADSVPPRPTGPVDLDDLLLAEAARRRPATAVAIDAHAVSAGQVEGSAGDLRRLVRNLLDNAVRHAASQVTLSLHEIDAADGGGPTIELVVADDGPGIPPELREEVFERFARLDASRPRGEGTGLGLAIVRDIVERHGGSVAIDGADRQGTRVVVRLPAAVVGARRPDREASPQTSGTDGG